MPSITGTIADTGMTPLGPTQAAKVVFRISQPAADFSGTVHVPEDSISPVGATGNFSVDMPEYLAGVLVWVGVAWRGNPSDIAAGRPPRIAWMPRAIRVPAAGGALADLLGASPESGLYWEGPTPPPGSMLWQFLDPSYNPVTATTLPVYTLPDGTTITHGEIVEWSA